MNIRNLHSTILIMLLTFTSLGAATSTAFSQNLQEQLVGEMKNFVLHSSRREAPDVSFEDKDEKTRTLSEFDGKVIVLNFWATWCAPCRKEMPGLDRLHAKLGSDKFMVLALGQDLGGISKVTRFLRALKIKNLDIYNDKTVKSGRTFGVFGLPATLIIDKQGMEVGRLVGPAEWDSPEAVDLITKIIQE
jgi:thiol-disulfide isomerase/thioredoxin